MWRNARRRGARGGAGEPAGRKKDLAAMGSDAAGAAHPAWGGRLYMDRQRPLRVDGQRLYSGGQGFGEFRSRRQDRCGLCEGKSAGEGRRSEEHTSELQSLMRISYAVFCLKKKKTKR